MRRLIAGFLALVATTALLLTAAVVSRGWAPSATPAYAFTPPTSGLYLALDCDVFAPGIQDTCYTAPFSNRDVAVVLGNIDVAGLTVGSFNFEVRGTLVQLAPLPATPDPDNSNPDFNEAAFPPDFTCNGPETPPSPDIDPGPATASRLVCFTAGAAADVPAGSTITLGVVKYVAASGPAPVANSLSLANVDIGNAASILVLSCNPGSVGGPCSGSEVIINNHVLPTATYTRTPTATPTATPTPLPDGDGDGVPDASDNCPADPNPDQEQADGNWIVLGPDKPYNDVTWPNSDTTGDACDLDDDNDGRTDVDELAGTDCLTASNPVVRDTDGDRFLDHRECQLGFDPANAESKPQLSDCGDMSDGDGDGLNQRVETCFYGTSILDTDTDGDGCDDDTEIASINADTSVNAIDLSQVAQAYGAYPIGAPAYLYNFDFNKDANINAIDLSQVAQRFGNC